MQKQLSISLLLLFGIALTSCVKQELEKPCPLVLNLSSTWSPDTEQIQVRAATTTLLIPEGTTLGIRAQDDVAGAPTTTYTSYTAAADGSVSPTNATAAVLLKQHHNYNVSIYSPFRSGATTEGTFVHGEDVMWTALISGVKAGVEVKKSLAHKMSQADMTIVYASGVAQELIDNYPLANATIEVTGFYDNCTMDLITGVITAGTTRNAKITEIGKAVCFVPFAGGNVSVHMKLTLNGLDGTTKVFEEDINKSIGSGFSMHFTVMIDGDGLSQEITITGTVQQWDTGDDTDVEVL